MTPTTPRVCSFLTITTLLVAILPSHAALVETYIAAEYQQWDYAPSGLDLCTGEPLSSPASAPWTTMGIGTTYTKARFVEYADGQYDTPLPRPAEEEHLGILGPLLRVAVGDTLRVHFFNSLDIPANMAIEGLAVLNADSANFEVAPNKSTTWTWQVPESAGPLPTEPSTKLWLYKSMISPDHPNMGLLGPVLVTGSGRSTGSLDREFISLFQVFDENTSPLLDTNLDAAGIVCVHADHDEAGGKNDADAGKNTTASAPAPSSATAGSTHSVHGRRLQSTVGDEEDVVCFKGLDTSRISPGAAARIYLQDNNAQGPWEQAMMLATAQESNLKHTINGFIFCNVPGLNMTMGDIVRWHVTAVGNEVDLHTAHWHGLTFNHSGSTVDEVLLLPGSVESLETLIDSPSTWLLHCHVNDHILAGMAALFTVEGTPLTDAQLQLNGRVREYYIAAELITWDYAPLGVDMCSGEATNFTDEQNVFVQPGPDRFGSTYQKAVYVQYTDANYTQKYQRPAEEQHLGLLGPLLRGEIGDTIVIRFLNRLPIPVSMHTHGALYDKSSEGTPYADGSDATAKLGAAVPPNTAFTYTWKLPQRSAPGPAEGSSKLWMYHSHTSEVGDTYAGLMGGMVVTRQGMADAAGKPKDVEREYVLLFLVGNEQKSSLFDLNMVNLFGEEAANATVQLEEDPDFAESNLMHAINGYVYCNLPGLVARPDERVRLYIMGLGTEVDMHTPSLHTTSFNLSQSTHQAISLLPGVMRTADVLPSTPGTLTLQCNVYDHIIAGMSSLMTIQPGTTAPAAILAAANQPVKTYYIAAEPIAWNYMPLGRNACKRIWRTESTQLEKEDEEDEEHGDGAGVHLNRTGSSVGTVFLKAVYRGYTDGTFTRPLATTPQDGLLGPTLRVAVGETLQVVFLNRLNFSVNLAVGGGLVPLNNDTLETATAGADGVPPGERVTYQWTVPASAVRGGPADVWGLFTYGSTVDVVGHSYAGLQGLVRVSNRPGFRSDVTAQDSSTSDPSGDQEIPLIMMNVDESASVLYEENLARAGLTAEQVDPDSTVMHALNGYLFCNAPPLQLTMGATSRWLLAALGSESDLHTPMFVQQQLLEEGRAVSTVELLPSITKVVTVQATTKGLWEVHCNVAHHYEQGMRMGLQVV